MVYVMERVLARKLAVREAAELIELSERQIFMFRLKGGRKKEDIAKEFQEIAGTC